MLLLFVIFSGQFATWSMAQKKIQGLAQDTLNQPLEYVTVVLTAHAEGTILAFAQTNIKGCFSFSINHPPDSIILTARSLGFETLELHFASQTLPDTIHLTMVTSALGLREIVIRAEAPPVVVHNDTTEFNAASFSDSTEFSVEDLLKKLPGIQVSENGRISLNGKPVEKVMIEGDDLFGDNYQIATRNVRANMVSKVQAINRYQENPMLKGIQESDRLILNLKFKDEKKRANSGSIMAGPGYGSEWKGFTHLNLFSLSRKDKIYMIGNANNTGENALADIEWLSRGDTRDVGWESLQTTALNVQPILQKPSFQQIGLPIAFTQANKSGMLFAGYVLPVSQQFKIKVSSWSGVESTGQNSQSETRYLLVGQNTLVISEKLGQQQKTGIRNVQTEADYFSTDNRHSIRNFIKISDSPRHDAVSVLRTQQTTDYFQISNSTDAKTFFANGALEYTFKPSETEALQLLTKQAWYLNTNELYSDYAYYPFFFGLDSSFNRMHQTSKQRQNAGLVSVRFLTRRAPLDWTLETGIHWTGDYLNSGFSLANDEGEQWIPETSYGNNFQIRSPRLFTGISVSRSHKSLFTRLRLKTSYFRIHPSRHSFKNLWSLEPACSLRYSPNDRNIWTAFYNYSPEIPSFSNLYPQFIFTDYQTLESGLPAFSFIPEHNAGLRYRFNHLVKQYSWNLGATGRWVSGDFATRYEIDPYLFIEKKFRPARSSQYALSGSADRYFHAISSRFELRLAFTSLQQQNKLNDDGLRQINSHIFTSTIQYGTAFDGWVNGILSHSITWFNSSSYSAGGNTSLGTTNSSSTLTITVKPSKRFYTKFNFYRVENHSEGRPRTLYWASDGICSFHLPAWRSQFQLSGFNLLNTHRFEQVFSDNFFQNATSIVAIPRFFLITWEYGF